MPSLSELTDFEVPQPEPTPAIPRVYIDTSDKPKEKNIVEKVTDRLLGLHGEERYQLWPEKVVREGLSAAGDAMANGTIAPGLRREDFTDIPAPDMPTKDSTWLGKALNIAPVAASPADPLIEKAQAISALAGSGGLAGTTDATLGATPFLRPALKYKDRLYKGKEGQQHMDVIPEALYPEFQKMAMSGEDISHYNFGFVNEKGHFLDREKALEYGINNGLIDPQAGKFGALTSTLMADSSKPGTAIEAARTITNLKGEKINAPRVFYRGTNAGDERRITTGIENWDKHTFAADNLDAAKMYGKDIATYEAKPDAKILYEGTKEFNNIAGKIKKDESLLQYSHRAAEAAKAAGYDAAWFKRQGDVGTAIFNPDKFILKADSSKPGTAIEAMAKSWKVKGHENDNWYHGTTHDFNKFNLNKGNIENFGGQYPHFTNSPKDASANYAGHGPDLTGRIERRAEELMQDAPDFKWGTEEYKQVYEKAKAEAAKEIAGPHDGAVIPANVKMEKPADITPEGKTWIDFNPKLDKEGEWVKDHPNMGKLLNSLKKQGEKYGFNGQKAFDEVAEKAELYNGDIKASALHKALKDSEELMYAEHPEGKGMVGSHVAATVFKDLGFDGIVMDAKSAFPNMKNIDEGTKHAIVLKPNTVQSKLTGKTLFADSSKESAAIQSIKEPFYSALEHNVSKINQNKMNGEAWLGTLANKPGVKPEELDWTGLKSFLEENKGKPVTKAQIEEHLAANKVELKEVSKGKAGAKAPAGAWDAAFERLKLEHPDINPTSHRFLNMVDDAVEKTVNPGGTTKYHSYQLPGGENYREMLLTLPVDRLAYAKKAAGAAWDKMTPDQQAEFASKPIKGSADLGTYKSSHWDEPNILAHVRMNDRTMPVEYTAEEKAALAAHENAQLELNKIKEGQRQVALEIQKAAKPLEQARKAKILADAKAGKISNGEAMHQLENYESPPDLKPLQDKLQELRSDESKLLASLPEKPSPKTVKSLHLEEIQSDWHQQGRDKGYKSELTPAEKNEMYALTAERQNHPIRFTEEKAKREQELANRYEASKQGVPDAPFKKSWHELALKRMIREAAEKGYDRLSWTPGEAQAERYSLAKQVDKIAVPMVNENGTRSVRIDSKEGTPFKLMVDKNGKVEGAGASSDQFSGKPLSDVVGKEMADKIMKLDKPNEFSGDGLKIGGEGMKGFYDQIIPKSIEKIGKEHGVKVKQGELPTASNGDTIISRNGYHAVANSHGNIIEKFDTKTEAKNFIAKRQSNAPVHYIDIPQSLRDTAMRKGFPLFSSTHMFVPVDHEPDFKK